MMKNRRFEFESTDNFSCQAVIAICRFYSFNFLFHNIVNFKGSCEYLGNIGSVVVARNSIRKENLVY